MIYASMFEFMRAKVGRNWVLARRTPSIVRRYGEDVICLSPAKYKALQAAFDAQAPSVDNAARAMLVALKAMYGRYWVELDGTRMSPECEVARVAIAQAEAAGVK